MVAARRPPSSDPANVQLWRPTAMPRRARSAALFDMHRRPSSRKRVSAVQRLRLYWIALAISFCAESLRALLAQPGLQRGDQRPTALVAHPLALMRRCAVDLALDRANSPSMRATA